MPRYKKKIGLPVAHQCGPWISITQGPLTDPNGLPGTKIVKKCHLEKETEMPGSKRKAKGNGKYERKVLKKAPKAIICYAPQICPDVMRVKLPYTVLLDQSGGGATNIVDNVYRGNSVFDPDFAIGGQQAMGHDQWSSFYRRYRVISTKISVRGVNDSAETVMAFIVPMNTSVGITDRQQISELQYAKKVSLGQDSGNNKGTVNHYMSTAQIRGGPQDIVQYEQDLSALVNTNPTQQWFWHVGTFAFGSGSTNYGAQLLVSIEYYVEYYDRETLSRS